MSFGVSERAALAAIVESPDPRVTANERLRAIELLRDVGGADNDGTLRLARWLSEMSDTELLDVVRGYFPIDTAAEEARLEVEVMRRVAERLPAAVSAALERRSFGKGS